MRDTATSNTTLHGQRLIHSRTLSRMVRVDITFITLSAVRTRKIASPLQPQDFDT